MLAHNVENLMNRLREAELSLNRLRREKLLSGADELLAGAETLPGGVRLICAEIAADAEGARELASKLVEPAGRVRAVGGARGRKAQLRLCARRGRSLQYGRAPERGGAASGRKGWRQAGLCAGRRPLEALWAAKAMLERGEAQ